MFSNRTFGVALACCVCFGSGTTLGQEFRIESKIFVGEETVPVSKNLTLFVDGKEIFSELAPTIDARTLRFYGSGPVGAVLYFDDLVVRAPEGETSNDR